MTCGENIGNAGKYLEKLCAAKEFNFLGCTPIVMPENYIAIYPTPTHEESLNILHQAERVIDEAALLIKENKEFSQPAITLKDKMSSGIVNDIFYPVFVHAKKFYASDACISCGKCANVCPLNNIQLQQGKPVWGKDCTHCMACICRCPSEAIEYGEKSKGMNRYICPKSI